VIGRKPPSRLGRALGLAVYALALFASAPIAQAQSFRVERVGFSAPVGGQAAAAAALPPAASLSGAGVTLSASPALLSAPSLSAFAAPSAVLPAALPAAAPAPATSPAEAPAARAAAPPLAIGESPASRAEPPSAAAAFSGAARRERSATAPAAGERRSSEGERDSAARDFSALTGERLIAGAPDVSGPPVAAAGAAAAPAPRLAPSKGARALVALPAALALGLPAFHPGIAGWHALSQAGYVAGNAGAAIFPLVQIYETYHGKTTPRSRAIVGAVASLALGLICAPVLRKALWGVQNVFGGVTLLVPLLMRVRSSPGGGFKATAAIALAAAALSAGIYFAAAAAVPAALSALFSAAAVAKIVTAVQFATSAMFLWMFLPDAVKVLRGKAAGGFSPGFNLTFFLSAVGSMVWAVPSAWIYSGADQNTYRLIFAVNAIYALTSFLSFWFARREAKP
jgi:hypothetical protein